MIQFIIVYFISQISACTIMVPFAKTARQFWFGLAVIQIVIMVILAHLISSL